MAKAASLPGLQILGPVGGIVGGAFGAIDASKSNSALTKSASREAYDIVSRGVNEKQLRAEQADQFTGTARVVQGSTGSSQLGSNALNFAEIVEQAAGDAGVDVKIIDDEMKSRLESLRERVRASSRSPILEGFQGAVMGLQAGQAIAGAAGAFAKAPTPKAKTPYYVKGLPGVHLSGLARRPVQWG